MVSRVASWLGPVRVTSAYAGLLVLVTTALWALGPQVRDAAVGGASTNLHNLAHGHLGTLLSSAFVTDDNTVNDMLVWLPGFVGLLASAELIWRGRRLILAFALGHIGATLVVAVGLVVAIKQGWLPVSVEGASDVGISYGAAAVLGALTAAIPRRVRLVWMGWWLAIVVLVLASHPDFTAVGHVVALLLGMVLSTRLESPARWTPARVVLLAIGVTYGYLILGGWSLPAAPLAGVAGMLIALAAGGLELAPKMRANGSLGESAAAWPAEESLNGQPAAMSANALTVG